MDSSNPDKPAVPKADRPVMVAPSVAALMPVTRLVSRPLVTIVNGKLATVFELTRSAA